ITYDEHGGCYDHVAPPAAVPPDSFAPDGFTFNRYGVRVPAVVISPYVEEGTVLRPVPNQNLPHQGPPYPFDHCSIIATLRKCFKLGGPLGERDAVAPDLEGALTLEKPENLGPKHVEPVPGGPSPEEVEAHLKLPVEFLRRSFLSSTAFSPMAVAGYTSLKSLEQLFRRSHIIPDVYSSEPNTCARRKPSTQLTFTKKIARANALRGVRTGHKSL